jgi:hypothetical protein
VAQPALSENISRRPRLGYISIPQSRLWRCGALAPWRQERTDSLLGCVHPSADRWLLRHARSRLTAPRSTGWPATLTGFTRRCTTSSGQRSRSARCTGSTNFVLRWTVSLKRCSAMTGPEAKGRDHPHPGCECCPIGLFRCFGDGAMVASPAGRNVNLRWPGVTVLVRRCLRQIGDSSDVLNDAGP